MRKLLFLICIILSSKSVPHEQPFLDYVVYSTHAYVHAADNKIDIEGYSLKPSEFDVSSVGFMHGFKSNDVVTYVSVVITPTCRLISEKHDLDVPEIQLVMDRTAQLLNVNLRFGSVNKDLNLCGL